MGLGGGDSFWKNKILKYKRSLNPFLHVFISFSSTLLLSLFKREHLASWMNEPKWAPTQSPTVLQREEFQGFVKNVYNVTFSSPLEEGFNALGSFCWLEILLWPSAFARRGPQWRVTLDQIHNILLILLGASWDPAPHWPIPSTHLYTFHLCRKGPF